MGLSGEATFVGFGFGAIQAGLFLYEAFRSGAFGRLVVAEVISDVVEAVRGEGGYYHLNIAHPNGIEDARIGAIEIENPAEAADRQRLIQAIAEASEIATAVPSVDFYVSRGESSLHRILAEGLRHKAAHNGARAVIYAAENHNHAAEILEQQVFGEIPAEDYAAVRAKVRFVNTVIGKMSGVITDTQEIQSQGLRPITAADRRAFLVEAFNHILISKIEFPQAFRRGIAVFEEKSALLPFEEAKLYGHNAAHALAAYVGAIRGVRRIAEMAKMPDLMAFLRGAMVEESGAALIRKYRGFDPLFTPDGFAAYSDDLLRRMTNPYLCDTVERVGRDPARKLGWDDRLIGTMRLCLRQGVTPRRYTMGAAAALAALDRPAFEAETPLERMLYPLWDAVSPDPDERAAVLALLEEGWAALRQWIAAGFPDLEPSQ